MFGVIDIVAHHVENAVPELARHSVGFAADAEADTAVFIHESIYPRLRFVDILLRHFIKSIEVHCEIEVVRIPRSEDILLAEVQAGGAGYHDEHHGNEDADRGKTRSVALHAVDHRGHGDEVVGLIVIALVFLQNAAQQNRACDKKQVGRRNDHEHRNKEPAEGSNGLLDGDGNVVGCGEDDYAENAEYPVCLGRLFADAFAAQKLDGVGQADLPYRFKKQQKENADKQQHGVAHRRRIDGEVVACVRLDKERKTELGKLRQRNTEDKAEHERHGRKDERFAKKHSCDIALAHAEDVIQAELLFPPADEERVCIKQEQHGEKADDARTEAEHAAEGRAAAHFIQKFSGGQ